MNDEDPLSKIPTGVVSFADHVPNRARMRALRKRATFRATPPSNGRHLHGCRVEPATKRSQRPTQSFGSKGVSPDCRADLRMRAIKINKANPNPPPRRRAKIEKTNPPPSRLAQHLRTEN